MDHWRNQTGNQKIPKDKRKWKHDNPKTMGCSKSSSKREVYINRLLPQETRKISNKQPNLIPRSSRDKKRIRKTQR